MASWNYSFAKMWCSGYAEFNAGGVLNRTNGLECLINTALHAV